MRSQACRKWRARAVTSLLGLQADVIGLQEPSPVQAADLHAALSPHGWHVSVLACDPEAWASSGTSGPEAQARDGNGFVWRASRLRLLRLASFPLPSRSPFKRTCAVARFVDRGGGQLISVLSARCLALLGLLTHHA